jgi:hypothetical protein
MNAALTPAASSFDLWPVVVILAIAAAVAGVVLWHRRNPSAADKAAGAVSAAAQSALHSAVDHIGTLANTVEAQAKVIASPPVQAAINATPPAATAPPTAQIAPQATIVAPEGSTPPTPTFAPPAPAMQAGDYPKWVATADGGQFWAVSANAEAEHAILTAQTIAHNEALAAANSAKLVPYTNGLALPPLSPPMVAYYAPGGGGYIPGMMTPDDAVGQFNALAADDCARFTWLNKVSGNAPTAPGATFCSFMLRNWLPQVWSGVMERVQRAEQMNPSRSWDYTPPAGSWPW